MITDRVKQTKAYQTAGTKLPLSVWEEVAELAAKNCVDLNSVTSVCGDSFIFGEPRTRLTIFASPSRANFQSVHLYKIETSVNQLKKINDSKVPILYTGQEGLNRGDSIALAQIDSNGDFTGQHQIYKVITSRTLYPGWYEILLEPEALIN